MFLLSVYNPSIFIKITFKELRFGESRNEKAAATEAKKKKWQSDCDGEGDEKECASTIGSIKKRNKIGFSSRKRGETSCFITQLVAGSVSGALHINKESNIIEFNRTYELYLV